MLKVPSLSKAQILGHSFVDSEIDVQIPTRIPEKTVVALFSGIIVNSGIEVEAGRHIIVSKVNVT